MGLEPSIWPLMLASLSTGLVSFEGVEEEEGDISLKIPVLHCLFLKVEWLTLASGFDPCRLGFAA